MKRWRKVTPIPLEFNGMGILYECVKCHGVVTYLGGKKEPPWECEKCKQNSKEVQNG